MLCPVKAPLRVMLTSVSELETDTCNLRATVKISILLLLLLLLLRTKAWSNALVLLRVDITEVRW